MPALIDSWVTSSSLFSPSSTPIHPSFFRLALLPISPALLPSDLSSSFSHTEVPLPDFGSSLPLHTNGFDRCPQGRGGGERSSLNFRSLSSFRPNPCSSSLQFSFINLSLLSPFPAFQFCIFCAANGHFRAFFPAFFLFLIIHPHSSGLQ